MPLQPLAAPESAGKHVLLFRGKTSIRTKILRQLFLLVTFCILLLGGLSFFMVTSFLADLKAYATALQDPRALGFTILLISGLLLALAFLLGTLLSRGLTSGIHELSTKIGSLKTGQWDFRQTVHTGDEMEELDRVFADMAARLKQLYTHLEDEVRSRTAELKQRYALDRSILQAIDYGVCSVDQDGIIRETNPAACRLLMLARDGIVGKRAADVLQLRTRSPIKNHPVTECLSTRRPFRSTSSMHMSLERGDGSLLPVMVVADALIVDGSSYGAVVVFQDVAEERQVDYMKSEFVSLASHQLRTPLSALRWYVELFGEKKESLDEEHREYLTEMKSSVDRMVNLLNALLHTARLEERGIEPEMKPVDIVAMLRETEAELQELSRTAGMKQHVEVPTEPTELTTDPTLLSIVIQNLISNAVKYGKKDGMISVAFARKGTRVELSVTNDGIGIPAEEQARVFEKFFRAKNVRHIDTDGNGLGLHISRSIVDRLGGTLSFSSRENESTTFTISLPVQPIPNKNPKL